MTVSHRCVGCNICVINFLLGIGWYVRYTCVIEVAPSQPGGKMVSSWLSLYLTSVRLPLLGLGQAPAI